MSLLVMSLRSVLTLEIIESNDVFMLLNIREKEKTLHLNKQTTKIYQHTCNNKPENYSYVIPSGVTLFKRSNEIPLPNIIFFFTLHS
jgi:predicted protein tyrosine phosphatase